MRNIWFLRTDKGEQDFNFTKEKSCISSMHGTCCKLSIPNKYKEKILPKLKLNEKGVKQLVRKIKEEFISKGFLPKNEKKNCDIAISQWISTMKIGDIVFVRNKNQEVYLCEITGYISEKFFDDFGSFQRPVKIISSIIKDSIHDDIWGRTTSRKTIERNNDPHITELVNEFLNSPISRQQYANQNN